jgi:AhpD family alkylhydroperoxidase
MSMLLVLAWLAAPASAGSFSAQVGVAALVDVYVVNDPAFAVVSRESIQKVLQHADVAVRRHLGATSPEWDVHESVSPQAMHALLGAVTLARCQQRFAGRTPKSLDDFDRPSLRQDVAKFLHRWPILPLLRSFQGAYDYDDVARLLLVQMRSQAEEWLPSSDFGRRFSDWMCWLSAHEDSVVITNQTVHFDWLSEPFPHTVRNGSLLSGATVANSQSRILMGRSLVVSTSKRATPVEQTELIGDFVLAHELGHALVRIPDVYDHGPDCLMNTEMSESRERQVQLFVSKAKRCKKCRVHHAARATFERMQREASNGSLATAERTMRRAFTKLPSVADGPEKEWRSYWLTELGAKALGKKKPRIASRLATEALAEWPENVAALRVLQKARGVGAPSAR